MYESRTVVEAIYVLRWWPYCGDAVSDNCYDTSYIVGVYTNFAQMELAKCYVQEKYTGSVYDVSENAFDYDKLERLNDVLPEVKPEL